MSSYPPLGTPTGEIPGLKQRGNISLSVRPRYQWPEGGMSTVRGMSFAESPEGPHILVPTISDEGRLLSDPEAQAAYRETGKHLGMFDTPENASAYSWQVHLAQEARPPLTFEEAKRRGVLRALQELGP